LNDFLDGTIDASAFDAQFEQTYLADPFPWSDNVFRVLDRLFAEADAYCPDPGLFDPSLGNIGPEELRRVCEGARSDLLRLME